MSDLIAWMHAHMGQLQTGGLILVSVLLVMALILLNRVASELYKSRSQRLMTEQTFAKIGAMLAARERGDGGFDELRGTRRVPLSGPVQRSVRPVSAKVEPKPAPRAEPKPPAMPGARMAPRRFLH